VRNPLGSAQKEKACAEVGIIFNKYLFKEDEDEKNIILNDIFNLINEKHIKKYILNNIDVSIKWRVYDNTDLLHYYTDGAGIFADRAINEHTKLLLNDITQI